MLFKAATEKDKEVKTELQERHDIFVAQVNEQVVHMHVEAERARRREWAKRDLSFRRSEELLHKARDIVEHRPPRQGLGRRIPGHCRETRRVAARPIILTAASTLEAPICGCKIR